MMLKLVHPNTSYQFRVYPKLKYAVCSKFLPPYMPHTLYSKMSMFKTFVKEIKRNIGDGTKAYWLAEGMKAYERNRDMVASLLPSHTSSATTVQEVKGSQG